MTTKKYAPSPAGEKLLEAALDNAEAQYRKQYSDDGKTIEEDARQRVSELAKPITAEECRAVGAPVRSDDDSGNISLAAQLHDTSKAPNIIAASAHAERLRLAKNTRCLDLAADMSDSIVPQNSLERALASQLAAVHAHSMRLMEKSIEWLENASPSIGKDGHDQLSYVHTPASIEAVRLSNAAARLMKNFQEGILTLAKMRGSGQQQVTVVHQHVQVDGGNVAVAGNVRGDQQ